MVPNPRGDPLGDTKATVGKSEGGIWPAAPLHTSKALPNFEGVE